MRTRSWWIIGIVGLIGALCLCGGLGVGIAAYRFLPEMLTRLPQATRPSPTPPQTRERTPPPPTPTTERIATPERTATPLASPTRALETPGSVRWRLRQEIPVEAFQMAVAPDGSRLAVGESGRIRILDPRTNRELARFPVEAGVEVNRMAFSPDGRWLVVSTGETVELLNLTAQTVDHVFFPTGQAREVAFSPQGTLVLVGTESHLIGYYLESRRPAFEFELYGPGDALVMDADERLIFQITRGETDMEVWDAYAGEGWGSIAFEPISAIALSPDGQMLAVAENQQAEHPTYGMVLAPGRAALWRVEVNPDERDVTLQLQAELDFPQETEGADLPVILQQLAFSPDGRWIAGIADWMGEGDTRGRLYLWETATGRRLAREILPGRPLGLGFVEDGAGLAVLLGTGAPVPVDHRIQIWTTAP
ncbi:MAG: hypothetical protein RMK32_00650 [Anaerolineae bacterium]|nr:hypothetical protein [Anaerolineae bacterium]